MRKFLIVALLTLCAQSATAHEDMMTENEFILFVDVGAFEIDGFHAYASYELPGLDSDTMIVAALGTRNDGESVSWAPLPKVITTTQTLVILTWYFRDNLFVIAVHANRNVEIGLLEAILSGGYLVKVSVLPQQLVPLDPSDDLPTPANEDALFIASMERLINVDDFISGENDFALALSWPQLTADALQYGLTQAYIEFQYPGRRSRGWMTLPVVILADVGSMDISTEFQEGQIALSVSATPVLTTEC